MEFQNIRKPNRWSLVLNYCSLIAVLAVFYTGKILGWNLLFFLAGFVALALFVFTFWRAFLRTRFWKMVHTSSQNLDERELQVVLKALRNSYSIFTITCLIVIYAFAVTGLQPVDVIMAGALLYLAHTLPAAVVGWNERYPVMNDTVKER